MLKTLVRSNLIFVLFLSLMGCQTKENDGWVPELYTGDHKNKRITRGLERGHVSCEAKIFDDYACLSHKDLERLFKSCLDRSKPWYHIGQ